MGCVETISMQKNAHNGYIYDSFMKREKSKLEMASKGPLYGH